MVKPLYSALKAIYTPERESAGINVQSVIIRETNHSVAAHIAARLSILQATVPGFFRLQLSVSDYRTLDRVYCIV